MPISRKPEDRKIDYLELPAADFDSVQEFYSRVFDWIFTDYGPQYRAFTDGKLDGGFIDRMPNHLLIVALL